MPNTKEVGSLFAHTMSYPNTNFPLLEKGFSQEIDYPFRKGSSIVVRIPFTTRAVVLGKWGQAQDEEEALMDAIGARNITFGEIYVQKGQPFVNTREDNEESIPSQQRHHRQLHRDSRI